MQAMTIPEGQNWPQVTNHSNSHTAQVLFNDVKYLLAIKLVQLRRGMLPDGDCHCCAYDPGTLYINSSV